MSKRENIQYSKLPTPDQLEAAARLIDSTLHRPLKRRAFHRAAVFVLALNATAEVVGVAGIRRVKRGSGEFGFFAVDEAYRQQGIGTRLTESVIAEARRREIQMLYAWVEKTNLASMRTLEKCGFLSFGDYAKRPGRTVVKSWIYLPLSPEADCRSMMKEITSGLTRVEEER